MTQDIINLQQLRNASHDADTLAEAVNGDENSDVTSRLGKQYPTLAKLLKMIETQAQQKLRRTPSIASLRGLNATVNGERISVDAYHAGGLTGGGEFVADKSDTRTADDGGLVIVSTGGTRWKRVLTGVPSVQDFGAKGDGRTDDTLAIRNAKTAKAYVVPHGIYKITDFTLVMSDWQSETAKFLYNNAQLPIGTVNEWLRLDVPSVFTSIQAAVDYCKFKLPSLTPNGFLQIKIADGTYTLTQIEIPFATDRVEIIGNTTNPNNVTLNFDARNNACGFIFQRGNSIYKIDGLTINGVGGWVSKGVWNTQCYGAGIMCNYNSQVLVGSKVRINKFYYGVSSRYGSGVRCEPGVIVQQAGDCGFFAYAASLDCQGCEAYHCAHTAEGLGFGFCAEQNGTIDASYSKAAHNGVAGFYALSNGSMWAYDLASSENKHGVLALSGGQISCNKMTTPSNSFRNTEYGYYASGGGKLNCNSALSASNGKGGFYADIKSSIDITVSTASQNSGNGYTAIDATLTGDAARSDNNTGNGFDLSVNSYLQGQNLTANNNTGHGFVFAHSHGKVKGYGGANNTRGFANAVSSNVITA